MSIKKLREKDINKAIRNKLKPKSYGDQKHTKGYIELDGIIVAKVKIPNEHPRFMSHKKTKYIALDLLLEDSEFESLIDCLLTGPKYFDLIRSRV